MSVAINLEYEQSSMGTKLKDMDPQTRRARAKRKWKKVQELMTAKADELGISSAIIQERTGRSASWVSKFNGTKATRFDSLDEYAGALGYDLSTFVALAEDFMVLEERHGMAVYDTDLTDDEADDD